MNVSMQKLVNAVNMYIDRDAMQTGAAMKSLDQFLFGFKLGIAREKAQNIIGNVVNDERMKAIGVVNEEGLIDIDAVYNAAKFSISKMNDKKIELYGFKLNEADVDKLYSYARS